MKRRDFLASTAALPLLGLVPTAKAEILKPKVISANTSPKGAPPPYGLDGVWLWAEINGEMLKIPVIRYVTTGIIRNLDQIFSSVPSSSPHDYKEAYAWLPFDRAQGTFPSDGYKYCLFWGAVKIILLQNPEIVIFHQIPESKHATVEEIKAKHL